MHVRCSYCNHSFNLSREFVTEALQEAEARDQKYYAVECIKCRKKIRVPLDQMRHFVGPLSEEAEE